VPSLGGIPKRIVDGTADVSAYSPAWSPDGKRIAYVQNNAIHIFHLKTKKSEKITDAKHAHCLSWSPDGSQIAYVSGNIAFVFGALELPESVFQFGNKAPSSIHILLLPRRSTIQVTSDDYLNVSPVWTQDGKHLLFVSNQGGSRDIYAVPLTSSGVPSGPPTRLTTGLDAHTISIAQDGQKLAYSVFNYTANIWTIEIPEKGSLSVSKAKQITKGNQIIENTEVSPNEQWLAYSSDLAGNSDIYIIPVSGGEAVQLTTHPSEDFAPRWSPDGEKIAFHSFRQGNRDIYCMTKDGGSIEQLTDDPSHEMGADWSPDGLKIAFMSDRTGRMELYVISKEGTGWGEPEQITFDEGSLLKWSPVGNSIVYISGDSVKIISYDDKKTKTLIKTRNTIRPSATEWSPGGKTIYYMALDRQGIGRIWSVPVKGGEPELKIIIDDPYLGLGSVSLSADSQRFYFTLRVSESNVWVMDLLSRE